MASDNGSAPAKTIRESIIEHRMGHLFKMATEYEELAKGESDNASARATWFRLAEFYRDWLKDTRRELEDHRLDPQRFSESLALLDALARTPDKEE